MLGIQIASKLHYHKSGKPSLLTGLTRKKGDMKEKIVWLISTLYYTSKISARLRFIQGGAAKM